MREMPSFGKALQSTVHREVQQEVEAAARSLADQPLKDFKRADLLDFNPGDLYEKQLEEAPLLMSALFAASTTQNFIDIKVCSSSISEGSPLFFMYSFMRFPQKPTRSGFGGTARGQQVDLKPMLAATASRLLHTRHPNLVNEMTKIHSIYHAYKQTPGKEHRRLNSYGDIYSKKVSLKLLDQVAEDWDEPILGLKQSVEELYMGGLSKTGRQALARRLNINGYVFHADNVGKVNNWLMSSNHSTSCRSSVQDTTPASRTRGTT